MITYHLALFLQVKTSVKKLVLGWDNGCGSVGTAFTSNTRGPRFEFSHRKKIMQHTFTVGKTKIKKKRPVRSIFKKLVLIVPIHNVRAHFGTLGSNFIVLHRDRTILSSILTKQVVQSLVQVLSCKHLIFSRIVGNTR